MRSRASGLNMANEFVRVQTERDTILFASAATSHTFRGHTNKSGLHYGCKCLPLHQKAGAGAPVKAMAVFLMWSVISSGLARLQHGGLRSVGKSSVKEERGSVYLSLLVGHYFSLWSVCRPAPGPPCEQQKPWGHCVVHGRLAWDSDSTGRDERASSGMPAGAGKIPFLAVSVCVDFHCAVHDTWRWVPWQHRSSPKRRFVYSQRQSKDLHRLNDRTDSVQLKLIMTWSFTGEICNKGYDIMGFGLLQSHPSSTHVQIVIAKQTTLLFSLFIQPRLTD